VPGELISAQGLADVAAVARELPGGLTSFFGFECRLGHEDRRADFLVRTRVDGGELEHLAGGLPDRLLQHPVWTRVREYARQLSAPASPSRHDFDRLWLEFDVDRAPAGIPLPSVFLGQRADSRPDREAILAAIALLRGTAVTDAAASHLRHCVDSLPRGATLFAVGLMLARPSAAVRLCIADLGVQGIPAYLQEAGWDGSLAGVSDLVTAWPGIVHRIGLHIDVGDAVGPKIGLEYHLRATHGRRPSWRPFLDELVRAGLCLPGKRDGLLAYEGVSDEVRDGARWPARWLRASRLLGPHWVSVNHRSLQYIKLACGTGQPAEAKAYLGALYTWVKRSTPGDYSQSSTDGSRSGSESRSSA